MTHFPGMGRMWNARRGPRSLAGLMAGPVAPPSDRIMAVLSRPAARWGRHTAPPAFTALLGGLPRDQ